MKFIHGADLHLDRSFEGLSKIPASFQPYLEQANQQMIQNIVDVAIEKQVDFVLLVGDTFHQNRPSLKTQQAFFQQIKRLGKQAIPVFMTFGNHDFYEAERYWFEFPENVHLYTEEKVETKFLTTKEQEKIAISGFSFLSPTLEQEKALEFPPRQNVDFHIGLYHGGQLPYAPFASHQLVEKGYDYWALGHIHVPQIVNEAPWIVYPGTPLGHTKKENDVTGVNYVSGTKGALEVESVTVAPVGWKKQELSLAEISQIRQVIPFITTQLQESQPTLLQLVLTNTEHLGDELTYQVQSDDLRQAVQERLPAEIFLTQLRVQQVSSQPVEIAVEQRLVQQLIATYEEPAVFNDILADLTQNSTLHGLITDPTFKQGVFEQLNQTIEEKYRFRRDSDAN